VKGEQGVTERCQVTRQVRQGSRLMRKRSPRRIGVLVGLCMTAFVVVMLLAIYGISVVTALAVAVAFGVITGWVVRLSG
jgi:Flp pilus assembly protein TadB